MLTSITSSIPAMSSIFFCFCFIGSPRLPRSQTSSQYVLPKALCQSAVHKVPQKCTSAACQLPYKPTLSLIIIIPFRKKACQHIPGAIRVVSKAIHADLLCFCCSKRQKDPQAAPELSGLLRVFSWCRRRDLNPHSLGTGA